MFKNKLLILLLLILTIHISFVFYYSSQKLLELHPFRQTQTAITSFWMLKDGLNLSYQTPVVGYPWSIPFEFPLFQAIVALITKFFGFNLSSVGRIVSAVFFWSSILPISIIFKKLNFSNEFLLIFLCLLLSSPLYFFWSRTFMIESAALFFTLMSIMYFIHFKINEFSIFNVLGFLFFSCLAILQKSTTAVPAFIVLYVIYYFDLFEKRKVKYNYRLLLKTFIIFLIPFIVGYFWICYTDYIKKQNLFGNTLTSGSLKNWNFGYLKQRISSDFFIMIWERIFKEEIGGFIGLGFLFYSVAFNKKISKKYVLIFFILFIIPLLLFTPLHIIHNYYQFSCVIFIIAILAYSISNFNYGSDAIKKYGIVLFVSFFVILNYTNGYSFYIRKARENITEFSNIDLAISKTIKKYTSENSSVLVYGKDWGSEIPFYSERKSFMVPCYFGEFDEIWNNPNGYMGGKQIDAIVFFTNDKKITLDAIKKYTLLKEFRLFKLEAEIYLMIRERKQIIYRNSLLSSLCFL